MLNYELFLLGIIFLSYLIPLVFIKTQKRKAIKKFLEESNRYNQIENFIEIKKYGFEKDEKRSLFLIGLSLTLFLAFKINNLTGAMAYLILGVGFVGLLSTYINLSELHKEILRKIYEKKDFQSIKNPN